jgi:hypothetical protein
MPPERNAFTPVIEAETHSEPFPPYGIDMCHKGFAVPLRSLVQFEVKTN